MREEYRGNVLKLKKWFLENVGKKLEISEKMLEHLGIYNYKSTSYLRVLSEVTLFLMHEQGYNVPKKARLLKSSEDDREVGSIESELGEDISGIRDTGDKDALKRMKKVRKEKIYRIREIIKKIEKVCKEEGCKFYDVTKFLGDTFEVRLINKVLEEKYGIDEGDKEEVKEKVEDNSREGSLASKYDLRVSLSKDRAEDVIEFLIDNVREDGGVSVVISMKEGEIDLVDKTRGS